MREIKFRAWDKTKHRMLGVCQLAFGPNGELVSIYSDGPDFSNDSEALMGDKPDLNEAVLMQYTGLKDMNGVDIYEGDVVRFDTNVQILESEVTYYHGMFTIKKYGEKIPLFTGLKVIGNRFENPELLEDMHNE